MCSYTIEVTDPKATSFTVQLQTATNVNVVLAKRATSSSYTDAKALNPNEVVTITVKEGDVYRIAAVSTGAGVGKLALAVQSPITGSAKPEDDHSGGIVGIVLLAYFVFPWFVLFLVMFILYCVKKRKISRNRQQRKQHSGYQNQPPPPMMYNQNYSYNQNTYRNQGVNNFY
jgi:flagellar basal body L-ring protein FlgH